MAIPRIIHQLWKRKAIPVRWRNAVHSVKRYHPGWEYRLWTHELMGPYVRAHHPGFYPIFAGFNRDSTRVDVFRYLLMRDVGGVYCALGYEFVRPFDYGNADLVLSLEHDEAYGAPFNQLATYVFASTPGHPFWTEVLAEIQQHPPFDVHPFTDAFASVFFRNQRSYGGVALTPMPVLSPQRVYGRYERKMYVNSGITYGFHHGRKTWRERVEWPYVSQKLARWFG